MIRPLLIFASFAYQMPTVAQQQKSDFATSQATTVSISSNANPSPVASDLSLASTVTGGFGSPITGYVTFTEDGRVLGIADVVAGIATLPVTSVTNQPPSVCSGVSCLGPNTAIKYVSQLGCAYQDTDLMYGGGHDDTACLNAALASATKDHPVLLWQDGKSLISGNGIQGPPDGYWGIIGNGGNATTVHVLHCTLSAGVATLTTAPNTFTPGQTVRLDNFSLCPVNGIIAQVSATGLSSTQIEVPATGSFSDRDEQLADVTALAGSGFYLADGSNGDIISNGVTPQSGSCEVPPGPIQARGANVLFQDFAINGNVNHNSQYCFGVDLVNLDNIRIANVMFYNIPRYAVKIANAGNVVFSGSKVISTFRTYGGTNDGLHIDGPANDITIYNDFFQTADDTVAVNSREGFCGPVSRVTWTNSVLDENWNAIRIYNDDLDVCPNGLVPLIDSVNLDNVSGSVYEGYVVNIGASAGGLGTLNPAITSFQYNNSTIQNLYPIDREGPFLLSDNIGSISLTNLTFESPDSTGLFVDNIDSGLVDHIGSLTLNNVTVERTPGGNKLGALFGQEDQGAVQFESLNINGFNLVDSGGSYGPIPCLLCSAQPQFSSSATNVTGVDPNQVLSLTEAGFGPFNITTPYPFGPPQLFNQFPIGHHSITATYSGDTNNPPATSDAFIQVVSGSHTSISLSSNANPSLSSNLLVLTCVVAGSGPTSGVITVSDGAKVIGSALVSAGIATLNISTLSPGPHSLVAAYGGDAVNEASISPILNQLVLQTTSVALSVNSNPALALSQITLSVVVSSETRYTPTGAVDFIDGSVLIGSAILDSNGLATLSISSLSSGQHSIVASFRGDLHNPPTNSSPLYEAILQRIASETLSWSPLGGQKVELKSSISASGPGVPTGTIVFVSNGVSLGVGSVDDAGSATVIVALSGGPINVIAMYSGDNFYAASNSAQALVGSPDFTLQITPTDISIPFEQQGKANVTIASVFGFTDAVQLSCVDPTNSMSCSFSPNNLVVAQNGTQSVGMVITTKAVMTSVVHGTKGTHTLAVAAVLVLFPEGCLLLCFRSRRSKDGYSILRLLALLMISAGILIGSTGCKTLQIAGTVPGTYVVGVSVHGVATGINQTAQLVVHVTQ